MKSPNTSCPYIYKIILCVFYGRYFITYHNCNISYILITVLNPEKSEEPRSPQNTRTEFQFDDDEDNESCSDVHDDDVESVSGINRNIKNVILRTTVNNNEKF